MGSTKNVLPLFNLTGGSLTTGSSWTTGSVGVSYLDNIGIHLVWTAAAAAAGTFSINASCDGTKYDVLGLSFAPNVAGSADSCLVTLTQVPFRFISVSYTSGTVGTGSVNAFITAKEIG